MPAIQFFGCDCKIEWKDMCSKCGRIKNDKDECSEFCFCKNKCPGGDCTPKCRFEGCEEECVSNGTTFHTYCLEHYPIFA